MKGFTVIELLIVLAILGILTSIAMVGFKDEDEKKEFMAYCQEKGNSEQDCLWEWKRFRNGQKSDSLIIIPMYMGR